MDEIYTTSGFIKVQVDSDNNCCLNSAVDFYENFDNKNDFIVIPQMINGDIISFLQKDIIKIPINVKSSKEFSFTGELNVNSSKDRYIVLYEIEGENNSYSTGFRSFCKFDYENFILKMGKIQMVNSEDEIPKNAQYYINISHVDYF